MSGVDAFEQILIDFTNMVVPSAFELPQSVLHPSPSSITQAATPFLALVAVNCVSLAVITVLGKVALRLIELCLEVLKWAFSLSLGGLVRALWRVCRPKSRRPSFEETHRSTGRTRVVEDAQEFEAWEKVIREGSASGMRPALSPEAVEALAVLGLTSFSSEGDIRKAYLSLMKIYHPDLFMNAPQSHQEMMGQRVLRIREAYDTITRELQQIQ